MGSSGKKNEENEMVKTKGCQESHANLPAALSLSTFISLKPLMSFSAFFEACASPSTV